MKKFLMPLCLLVFLAACEELDESQRAALTQDLGCPRGSLADRKLIWHGCQEGCKDEQGEWHGPFRALWGDGQIKDQGSYRHGLRQGPWRFSHVKGIPKETGPYAEGKRHGRWTFYDKGKKTAEGEYAQGIRHG
ncbi:MAG: hypothetical protein JRF33_22665, partial [Deltaproteobacteria bacterium]|nr:hypothetical protein [Deltaproteobacteria bacterium]